MKPAPAREAIGAAALAAAAMRTSPPPPPAMPGPPRPAAASPLASNGAIASATLAEEALGFSTLMGVGVAIGAMLFLAWVFRSQPAPPTNGGLPAIANAQMPTTCPAGTVPRSMIRVLEPGQIIDDTQPVIVDDTAGDPG